MQKILRAALFLVGGIILAGLVAIAIPSVGALIVKPPESRLSALTPVTEDAFGGPYTLIDENGRTVTEKDMTGRYRLFYFGFTYCPAICPTELSKISKALTTLGDQGKAVQPVFVSVDPERDTPEKLKSYVTLFKPQPVGLTGTPEQVKSMLKEYKVYAAKVEDPALSDYTMDHSSFIYFMAPDDRLLRIFKMEDTAETMAQDIRLWLDFEKGATLPASR